MVKLWVAKSCYPGSDITNYDASRCTIEHNSFLNTDLSVSAGDFIGLDTAQLIASRKPDGSLPDIKFMHLKPNSRLNNKGVGIISRSYKAKTKDLEKE